MTTTAFPQGILPYIPFFYVIWSDDLLSVSEIQVVQQAIAGDDSLDEADRHLLNSWLDRNDPPDDSIIKAWQNTISHSKAALIESETYPLERFSQKVAQFYCGSCAVNAHLRTIEINLGIQPNHYNHLFHVAVEHQPYSDHYDGQRILQLIQGEKTTTITEFQAVLNQALFQREIPRNKEQHRELVLEQLISIAQNGWGALAYLEAYGGKNTIESYASVFEQLLFVDGSLAVKFGVQFGLFGGSIQNLGSERHLETYLKAAGRADLLGCFAMTETGHGSNVRGIKTTATYVHDDRTLVIQTPGKNDNKEYIGNALHATMATVFAQLIVEGKNRGVHAILVPLRDTDHQLLPGIRIEDNGHKLGLNGVDNGKIWFSQVKVPVANLLDRYGGIDAAGQYRSSIDNPNKRFFTMLGTLVGGRICVAKGALAGAKMSLAIAVKHALRRRQFNDSVKIQEDLLLDYPTHQLRLLPKVATSYVYEIALGTAMQRYAANTSDDKREIETQAAGLKACITWFATQAIQEAREACGGKGYLSENRLGDLKNDTDIFTTFEGDNTVLLQLTAKGVLSDFRAEFNSGGFVSVLKLLGTRLSDTMSTLNPVYANKVDKDHLYNPKFHLHAHDFRTRRLTYSAAMRIRSYIKKGMPSYQAFLKVQTHLLELGKAYSEGLALAWFYEKVDQIPDPDYQALLYKLGTLHSLSTLRTHAEWYLESGYISGTKSKAIRQRVERLSTELRPHCNALVDGYGIADHLLRAPIAN
ncbi:MAG: acyl-CoA dehydrogenase family protein [Flavobacteriaceae bacterium]|nr:acyl-CoA dehydrogenase family protein [Flavobacteriaceae bacterium]